MIFLSKTIRKLLPGVVVNLIRKPLRLYYSSIERDIWMNYVYGDRSRPVEKNRVNVYYWKPPHIDNVGDLLSQVIVDSLIKYYSLKKDREVGETRRLFAIGSVIDAAQCKMVIWGSGVHRKTARIPSVEFDIRAVRGPETKKMLEQSNVSCPEIFGDPAVLLPLFFRPALKKRFPYTIVPHFSSQKHYLEKYPDHTISTLTSDWKGFVSRIIQSELVISGSLHGLILAEAYGVPAIALTDIDTDWFKYNDYYFSTGRYNYNKASSVDDALNMDPDKIPDFQYMRSSLLASFPKDLWAR